MRRHDPPPRPPPARVRPWRLPDQTKQAQGMKIVKLIVKKVCGCICFTDHATGLWPMLYNIAIFLDFLTCEPYNKLSTLYLVL